MSGLGLRNSNRLDDSDDINEAKRRKTEDNNLDESDAESEEEALPGAIRQIDDSESSQRERMISDISDDDDVVRLDDDDDIHVVNNPAPCRDIDEAIEEIERVLKEDADEALRHAQRQKSINDRRSANANSGTATASLTRCLPAFSSHQAPPPDQATGTASALQPPDWLNSIVIEQIALSAMKTAIAQEQSNTVTPALKDKITSYIEGAVDHNSGGASVNVIVTLRREAPACSSVMDNNYEIIRIIRVFCAHEGVHAEVLVSLGIDK